jgi:hypothetical protein
MSDSKEKNEQAAQNSNNDETPKSETSTTKAIYNILTSNWTPNVLAILALAMSTFSIYKDSPSITIEPATPITKWRCPEGQGQWRLVAVIPVDIINHGRQPAALTRIIKNESASPVLSLEGGSFQPKEAILYFPKIFDQKNWLEPQLPDELEEKLSDGRSVRINFESAAQDLEIGFSQGIPVGEPKTIPIGITVDSIRPSRRLKLNLVFKFDYKEIPVEMSMKIAPPTTSCPEN